MVVFLSVFGSIRCNAEEGQPATAEDLEELSWVSDHLKMHATHLLNLGRTNAPEEGSCDLSALLESTLSMLHTAGRTRRVEVEPSLPNYPLRVQASRVRMEQVLINLIGNAVDATEDLTGRSPELKISLRRQENFALCCIQDNGCGIPADKLQTIFEPYYTTKPPGRGTGLGLPVVKQIIESYQGKLTIESTPHQGSTFSFSIPLVALQ